VVRHEMIFEISINLGGFYFIKMNLVQIVQ